MTNIIRPDVTAEDSLPSNQAIGMNEKGLPTLLPTQALRFNIKTGYGDQALQPLAILKPWDNDEDGTRKAIVKFIFNGKPVFGIPLRLRGIKLWARWFAALEEAMTPKEPKEPEKVIEEGGT